MGNGDDTIAQIRQKNNILRERLSRLMNEDDEPWKHTDGVEKPESRHARKVSEEKENRQRYFQNLKQNVEELKRRDYELPGARAENHVRKYVPSESSFMDSFDTDPLEAEVSPEQELIVRLKEQLRLQTAERKEIIEEFQRKEASTFKEFRQKELQFKRELQQLEHERLQERRASEEKYAAVISRLKDEKSQQIKYDDALANEAHMKSSIKKISVKLVMYKRQIDELHTKNEALRSVNQFLTGSTRVSEPAVEAPFDARDEDTSELMQGSDNTTEMLIMGHKLGNDTERLIGARRSLKKYAHMALFVIRVRRLVASRKAIESRLDMLSHSLY